MKEKFPWELSETDATQVTVYPKDGGCTIRTAWLDDFDIEQEVRVTLTDVVFSVERRQSLAGESGGQWDTVHISPVGDLLESAPTRQPPGFKIMTALMIALCAQADIDRSARPYPLHAWRGAGWPRTSKPN